MMNPRFVTWMRLIKKPGEVLVVKLWMGAHPSSIASPGENQPYTLFASMIIRGL